MSKASPKRSDRLALRLAGMVVLAVGWAGASAAAAAGPAPAGNPGSPGPFPPEAEFRVPAGDVPLGITVASDCDGPAADCAGCQGGLSPLWGEAIACGSCGRDCVPGQKACYACTPKTRLGRFACGVYHALCCPDPCYQPQWSALADAAFFTPAARPQSQQRFRWDAGIGMVFPDRAEYFWARIGGRGPKPDAGGVTGLDYHELRMYTETATGKFAAFVDVPYRSVDPDGAPHGAGFGDMSMGTKSLLFDCELLQVTYQFRTCMPQANSRKGLGPGHLSLEPSLIVGLNAGPDTYLQAQVAEWIPLGGDSQFAGALLHYHVSLNRTFRRPQPDVLLISTWELNGWSFQDGSYTDPVRGTVSANDETYISLGPGLRLVICDRVDFGVAAAFAVTGNHWAEELIRSEFRWRF